MKNISIMFTILFSSITLAKNIKLDEPKLELIKSKRKTVEAFSASDSLIKSKNPILKFKSNIEPLKIPNLAKITVAPRPKLKTKKVKKKMKMKAKDQVKVKVSGTKKVVAKGKKVTKADDLPFFDYGNPNKQVKKKSLAQVSIDDMIKNFKMPKRKKELKRKVVDYSQLIQSAYKKESNEEFKLQITTIGMSGIQSGSDFDVMPFYNPNEIFSDSGMGSIGIPVTSAGEKYSTFRGSINAKNIRRTSFELSIQKDLLINVPVFERDRFEDLLEVARVKEYTASHLLIDLGDEIDSTNLKSKFAKKVFLNEKFDIVDPGSRYRYEMYLDIEPGNHLVQYMDLKGAIAEKIVHITYEDITYDEPLLEDGGFIFVELFEEHIIAKKNGPLKIDAEDIIYFNTKIKAQKEGINRYKIKAPIKDSAFRRYLQLGTESPIYVGFDKAKKIIIPSREYVDYFKQAFGMSERSEACVVQFNLSKVPVKFDSYVTSDKQSGSFEVYYMDKDGTVSKELTSLTERVFVVSYDFGVINAHYKTKKESKYVQSFCTKSLYLVEQL